MTPYVFLGFNLLDGATIKNHFWGIFISGNYFKCSSPFWLKDKYLKTEDCANERLAITFLTLKINNLHKRIPEFHNLCLATETQNIVKLTHQNFHARFKKRRRVQMKNSKSKSEKALFFSLTKIPSRNFLISLFFTWHFWFMRAADLNTNADPPRPAQAA